jgi:hypothetical protein
MKEMVEFAGSGTTSVDKVEGRRYFELNRSVGLEIHICSLMRAP